MTAIASDAYNLVCLFGTADTYLVCALAKALEEQHKTPVVLHIKTGHEAIAHMFPGTNYKIDDEIVERGETDQRLQRSYDNYLAKGRLTFVGCCRFG